MSVPCSQPSKQCSTGILGILVAAVPTMYAMSDYEWSPPEHPDPPEDQPYGVDGVQWSERVDHAPVWVRVEFSRTGWQRLPGFVDAATDRVVYVQFVHMGFGHRIWLDRDRVTVRQLKRRNDETPRPSK